jgi:hypothetical protein
MCLLWAKSVSEWPLPDNKISNSLLMLLTRDLHSFHGRQTHTHTHTHTHSHSHTSSVFYCDIGSLQDLCWKNIAPEELGQSCPEWTNSHQHTTTTKGRIGPEWINSHWQHRDGWMDWCLDVVQSWNPLFGCGLSSKHNNFFCQVHKSSFSLLYKENCKQRGPSNSWSPLYS